MMKLRPFQEIGRDFLASKKRALLADEMRVGKTPQAIAAADAIGAKKVLTVCPAIAVPHWQKEWKAWSPERPAAIALTGKEPKLTASLTVASFNMADKWREALCARQWDVLIVDECHFAKNPAAVRTKLIYGKESLAWHSGYIWALSGTPAPRHAGELWPMLVAFGITKFTYWEFLNRYCRCDLTGRPIGTKENMIPELRMLLNKIMLRRTRKEVAPEMPDIGFEFLEVIPTSPADLVVPKEIKDEALIQWLEVSAHSQSGIRQEVAKAKVGPLCEEIFFCLENNLLQQTVVFGFHVEPLEILVEVLRARGISAATITGKTSQKDRLAFQEGFRYNKISVLAVNILAGGIAIDLSAASHGYMLELDWVPGNNLQAASRLISMNKQEPVTIDVVTWRGSTDDQIQQVLVRRVKELSQLF